MATHSSILAWKIPRAVEPGGYSPWGCKELDATERLRTSGVNHLPLVCRKALVSQASPESQKAGSRVNDGKNINI